MPLPTKVVSTRKKQLSQNLRKGIHKQKQNIKKGTRSSKRRMNLKTNKSMEKSRYSYRTKLRQILELPGSMTFLDSFPKRKINVDKNPEKFADPAYMADNELDLESDLIWTSLEEFKNAWLSKASVKVKCDKKFKYVKEDLMEIQRGIYYLEEIMKRASVKD